MKLLKVDTTIYYDEPEDSYSTVEFIALDSTDYESILEVIEQDVLKTKEEEVEDIYDEDEDECDSLEEYFDNYYNYDYKIMLTEEEFKKAKDDRQIAYFDFDNDDVLYVQTKYFIIK